MKENENIMFSVELTTYNQKEYIAQTIQSILNQQHDYKYEILISDDCSNDGTQEIIKDFQSKYPEIIKPVYNEHNLGAMKNYYSNIIRAKGKYIMGCAGDDYWLPGKVKKQIDFMEKNKSFSVCYGNAQVLNDKDKTITSMLGGNYMNFKELLSRGNSIPALTLCIRTDFFSKYLKEIQPEKKDWLMEDYPFLIYAAFESNIFFIDDIFAVYRVIDNSVSHQTDFSKRLNFEKSVYEIKKFFSDRYSINIEPWNEKEIINNIKKKQSKKSILIYIKKIIKCFIPYGIIILFRKLSK